MPLRLLGRGECRKSDSFGRPGSTNNNWQERVVLKKEEFEQLSALFQMQLLV